MNVLGWIEKKRDGGELAPAEIEAFARGVADGSVPDYQAAAFLMAVYFRGMSGAETSALTRAMIDSGARLDLGSIPGVKVDKHSTGGVGDKISLPLAPAVAACGGRVPMISGRALGHTGGTLDKLEAIPGFRVALTLDELRRQVQDLGFAFGAATADLAPADRRLYALRDATGTVASIPLITSSILSKKVAEGIGALVLDVKTGGGAFLADPAAARTLAETLVATAESLGVRTVALLTDMSQPLGQAIGNALEVEEALAVLHGEGPEDVVELTCALGGEMLALAGIERDPDAARARIARALDDGTALAAFSAAVERQGGDPAIADDAALLPEARHSAVIAAERDGYLTAVDCRALGEIANALGAGRARIEDRIDPAVGLVVAKRIGEAVDQGETLVEARYNDRARFAAVERRLRAAFALGEAPPPSPPLVHGRIALGSGGFGR